MAEVSHVFGRRERDTEILGGGGNFTQWFAHSQSVWEPLP